MDSDDLMELDIFIEAVQVLLPTQQGTHSKEGLGLKRLYAAILITALQDAMSRKEETKQLVVDWMERKNAGVTFQAACDILGLDNTSVKRKLYSLLEGDTKGAYYIHTPSYTEPGTDDEEPGER